MPPKYTVPIRMLILLVIIKTNSTSTGIATGNHSIEYFVMVLSETNAKKCRCTPMNYSYHQSLSDY